jgi:hypothetical protein
MYILNKREVIINMQKLNKQTVNAISHNLILDTVLQCAWNFVCNLAPTNEFNYAFVNSAAEDYCDTIWHTTQNVKLSESLDLIDARDMYNTALDNYSSLLDTNIAHLTVESVYETLDEIYGDTAMREHYYSLLRAHFENFTKSDSNYALESTQYKGCYKLVSTHTYAQREELVRQYLEEHSAYDLIELNNTIA